MKISKQIGKRTKTKQNAKNNTRICFICEKSGKTKAFTKNTLTKCYKIMEIRKTKHREIKIPTSCRQEGYHVGCYNNFIGLENCEIESLANSTQDKQDMTTHTTNTDQNLDEISMPLPIKVPYFKVELEDDVGIIQKVIKSEDTMEYVETTETVNSGSQIPTFTTYLDPDISKPDILKSLLTRKSPVKRDMTENSLVFTYDFTNQANSNLTIENIRPKIERVPIHIENVQPHIEEVQPNTENVQPNIENVQPHIEKVQPNTENVQPNIGNVQPIIENLQPNTENLQPIIVKTTSAERVCIFCNMKVRKFGIKKDCLVKCNEDIHKKVSLWAYKSCDYDLVMKLENPRVYYHALCKTEYRYKSDFSNLYLHSVTTTNSWDKEDSVVFNNLHAEAFDSLCAFINDRIIDKHKTYLLTDLHERYKALLVEIQNSSTPFNFESLYIQCSPTLLQQKIINTYNGTIAISTSKVSKKKIVHKTDLNNFDNSVVENDELYDKLAFQLRSEVKSMKTSNKSLNSNIPENLFKFIGALIQGPDVREVDSNVSVKIKSICDIVAQTVKD